MIGRHLFVDGVLPRCDRVTQASLGFSLDACIKLRLPPHRLDMRAFTALAQSWRRRQHAYARDTWVHIVRIYDADAHIFVQMVRQYLGFLNMVNFQVAVVTRAHGPTVTEHADSPLCIYATARRSQLRCVKMRGDDISLTGCTFDKNQTLRVDFVRQRATLCAHE